MPSRLRQTSSSLQFVDWHENCPALQVHVSMQSPLITDSPDCRNGRLTYLTVLFARSQRRKWIKNWKASHLVISSVHQTAAVFYRFTVSSIKNKAFVALAAFKTLRTSRCLGKAGTSWCTSVGAQLIVTILRTIHCWKRKQKKKTPIFGHLYIFRKGYKQVRVPGDPGPVSGTKRECNETPAHRRALCTCIFTHSFTPGAI